MTKQELKDRILESTIALLHEVSDLDQITVRDIAARAGVGTGSINYNFGSKDELINEAIWKIVGDMAAGWYAPQTVPQEGAAQASALTRLKRLFKETGKTTFHYRKFTTTGIKHILESGNLQVQTLILPLLREILGSDTNEIQLRLTAFQLVASLQVALLNAEKLGEFLGINIFDEATLDLIIDTLINNLIPNRGETQK